MPQMTPAQARVIDPILSNVARGYKHPLMVGMALFPYVPVAQRGGKIIAFGREDFQIYNTARAPGADTKDLQIGYSAGSYGLEQHRLNAKVPNELKAEADAVPGINLQSAAVNKVQRIFALRLEKAQADIATNAANYDAANKTALGAGTQWNENGATSRPINDVEVAKERIRQNIGMPGNTVLIPAAVGKSLKNHPEILERLKYTGRDVATPDLVANLFDVETVVIGGAVYDTPAGAKADVWGKSVVVAYTTVGTLQDMGEPSYGYTYRLGGYPLVENGYEDRGKNSWLYPVTDEVSPVLAGADAGYLISAAVA